MSLNTDCIAAAESTRNSAAWLVLENKAKIVTHAARAVMASVRLVFGGMDFSITARQLWTSGGVYDISPKALGPTRGLSAVLGRNALETPGDCGQARFLIR
jgi:hypothetical protein